MKTLFRLLEGERSDMQKLQKLIDSCDQYYNQITGYPPGLAESETLYSSLPEGKDYADKMLFGLFDGEVLVGCADVIRHYPNLGTAEIGIFLIHGRRRRQGYGRDLFQHLEKAAMDWTDVHTLRTELPTFLDEAALFAHAIGLKPTGERRSYRYQHVTGEQVLLEKKLVRQ